MQIDDELARLIPLYALLGITEIQEMQWCFERGLTPAAIATFVGDGVRDLEEMARTPKPELDKRMMQARHRVNQDPFDLAGTSHWATSDPYEANPDEELPGER